MNQVFLKPLGSASAAGKRRSMVALGIAVLAGGLALAHPVRASEDTRTVVTPNLNTALRNIVQYQ